MSEREVIDNIGIVVLLIMITLAVLYYSKPSGNGHDQ